MTIGEKLRNARIACGLGVREAARLAGLKAGGGSYLCKIERGHVLRPGVKTVCRLRALYDIRLVDPAGAKPPPADVVRQRALLLHAKLLEGHVWDGYDHMSAWGAVR